MKEQLNRSPLYSSQRSDEEIKLGRIHVTHGNEVQMRHNGRMDGESRASFRNLRKGQFAWLLTQQDGDLVLMDRKYEQRRGLPIEIGQVSPFEGSVWRKRLGFWEIEAERNTPLKRSASRLAMIVSSRTMAAWMMPTMFGMVV